MRSAIALLCIGLAVGAGASHLWYTREREALARAQAERDASQTRQQAARLQAAQQRGDQLTHALAAAQSASADLQKERDDALRQVTAGRKCLSADAVGVLNRRPAAVPVSATPSQPAADATRAPAADPGQHRGAHAASDTDIARWAVDAQRRYADCAAQVNTLVEWHESDMQQGGMP